MWRSLPATLAAAVQGCGSPASGPGPRTLSSSRVSPGGDVTRAVADAAPGRPSVDDAHVAGADIRDPPSAQHVLSSGAQAESPGDEDGEQAVAMASRAYQLEMLDQSLKQNAIVAIVWFIAPTVSLSAQQHEVLKLQIPAVSMTMLAGNRHVPTWGPDIWNAVLEKARVVITTPQVLLDALDHAYITMGHLALLVFDEVHNCVGKNPGGKIMLNHYHPQRLAGKSVPAVLGLTATPSIRSEVEDLEALERLMNARCISPTLHRDELLKCVKRPEISHVVYTPGKDRVTPTMRALNQVYYDLDIREDPYILSLLKDPTERNMRALAAAVEKYDTFTQNQMKAFCSRSREVCRQLGPWVADLYIWKAISAYLERVNAGDEFLDQWLTSEKEYLAQVFRRVDAQPPPKTPQDIDDISDKVGLLLHELLSAEEATVGIIFVEERVMVNMLAEILSVNPAITAKYRIGTMMGSSGYNSRRRVMYEFGDKADYKVLQNFRSSKINLLLATAVLEEGIDVPACNLVVCFDTPTTSKSFIQRRGRARMKDSRLVIFFDESNPMQKKFEEKEEEMKKLYEDEQREFHRLEMVEESESPSSVCFTVESTGARLEFDNAKQHLEHFCRVLWSGEFVDSRPDYIVHQEPDSPRLTATVLLPPYVPVSPRQHTSASSWLSEKNATKDAAFQAYVALYRAGLVNEHLLPFKQNEIPGIDTRAPEVSVEPTMKPWHHVAAAWREPGDKWLYSLTCLDEEDRPVGEYQVLLPVWLNRPRPLHMFLDRNHKLELRLTAGTPVPHEQVASLPDHTSALLALHFSHRWPVEERQHVVRVWAKDGPLSMDQIGRFGHDALDEAVKGGRHLIRDNNNAPYLYKDTIGSKPAINLVQNAFYEYENAPEHVPYLVLNKWTRRTDFLHRLHGDPNKDQVSSRPYPRVYPLPWARVDAAPARHAQFGMLIPTIIHELGVMLMAKELASTVLEPVGISNLDLVKEAISARSASEPVNYERLEFLGDSILKFCTCIKAAALNPDWPEGYLSLWRDGFISNSRLYRAAVDSRLPRFIITKPFTGQKWRPLYLDDVLREDDAADPETRKLSTKTLADVVEALIGAAYVDGSRSGVKDGGLAKAVKCISVFLSQAEWGGVEADRQLLLGRVPENEPLPTILEPLEELVGYTFRRKALLTEALTHASCVADTGKRSLERLEFVGDAILDNIIVTRLSNVTPELPHYEMHTLKTGLVNGDFLAFMTMEHSLESTEAVVTADGDVETSQKLSFLWQFMRHASAPIGIEQEETKKRHAALRGGLLEAMDSGTHYPWALLAALNPKKFYSDLFEALLGAVWIDSGSVAACEAVVARFGLLKYLDRLLRDGVHVQHPKEELGKWANSETVSYQLSTKERADAPGEKEYFCKVVIGERLVVDVRGGINREEVKTKAATEALKVLVEEKNAAAAVAMDE
ncbi:hypothetical protein Trco_007351 [Trichoderma cornu-damae]|uniref:Dicer-like protein 2 n=1 Tax=Trichoderma cornu-damae TaxID=654480 RepID=A0A9P8QEA3_9HYPO|nr:hypothetical protein Trco_007351 [Trichoderma cornu-damae]